jgi:GR25 family glycosyltransferase involved in LPS biosynthesis
VKLKIVYINLKEDTKRNAFMQKQLQKFRFPFERQEAVNGKEYLKDGGTEYDESKVPNDTWFQKDGKLPAGLIGTTLSHKRALTSFSEQKEYDYLLLLEDDHRLPNNLEKIIEEAIKTPWDFLQLVSAYAKNFKEIIRLSFYTFYTQVIILKKQKGVAKLKRIPLPFLAMCGQFVFYIRMLSLQKSKKHIHKFFIKAPALAGANIYNKKSAKAVLKEFEFIRYSPEHSISNVWKKNKNIKFCFYTPSLDNPQFDSSLIRVNGGER